MSARPRKDFRPELRAPIIADVERQLEELVAKFGEKKVRESLDPLITKCKLAMRGEFDPSYSSSEMNGGSVFR